MAPAAQAEGQFLAGKYPASLTGTGTSAHTLSIAGGAREISCSSTSFTGELTAASAAVPIAPTYTVCASNPGSLPVNINPNSCSYTWIVSKIETATTASGSETLNCPAGKEYEIPVYQTPQKQAEGIPLCTYGIPPQGEVGSLGFTDLGSGTTATVAVSRNVTGLKINVLKGTKLSCGVAAGGSTTGQYTGSLELVAKNAGVQTGLKIG